MRKIRTKIAWLMTCAMFCTGFGVDFSGGSYASHAAEEQVTESTVALPEADATSSPDTDDSTVQEDAATSGDTATENTDTTENTDATEGTGDGTTDSNAGIITVTGVKAKWSNSGKCVTISWKKLAIAKGYYVYRKAGNGAYSKLKNTKSTNYKDKVKVLNMIYTYKVVAYLGTGDDMVLTPDSKEVSVKVPAMAAPKLKINKKGRTLRISISSFGLCTKAHVYIKVGNRKWKKLNTLKKRQYLEFRMLRHNLTYQFCVKGEGKVNGKKYYSGFSKAKKYRY